MQTSTRIRLEDFLVNYVCQNIVDVYQRGCAHVTRGFHAEVARDTQAIRCQLPLCDWHNLFSNLVVPGVRTDQAGGRCLRRSTIIDCPGAFSVCQASTRLRDRGRDPGEDRKSVV